MKWRRLVFWMVTTYICYIVTVLLFTYRIQSQKKEITVMSSTTALLEDQLTLTKNESESYKLKLLELQKEVNQVKLEKSEILKERESLLNELDTLKRNNLLAEQAIKKYELDAKSSSIAIQEKDTYISELNEKLDILGGVDIYEMPLRKKEFDNFTIWLEDGAHESYADQAMNYINLLPVGLIKEFSDNGWKFIITTRNLEEAYNSKTANTVGLTIYSKKRIYLVNEEAHIADALIHEFGHALDSLCDYISLKDEWITIYKEEKVKSHLSNYFISDPREYFAETVQQYFTYKGAVKKNTPESYEYIENLLKRYK